MGHTAWILRKEFADLIRSAVSHYHLLLLRVVGLLVSDGSRLIAFCLNRSLRKVPQWPSEKTMRAHGPFLLLSCDKVYKQRLQIFKYYEMMCSKPFSRESALTPYLLPRKDRTPLAAVLRMAGSS